METKYTPNSHKYKAEQAEKNKKEETNSKAVAQGTVRKKSTASKLVGNFVSEDIHNVKDYVILDVLIPAAKKALSDIVSNGIDMILYGETRDRKRNGSTYVSYDKYSRRDDRYREPRSRDRVSVEDVTFKSRREAENVLERMDEITDQSRDACVSVSDFYDLAGIRGNYTGNGYGWTRRDIVDARVREDRYGEWYIDLPRARAL